MTAGDEVQLVTFRLGGREFAFHVFDVERILRYQEPTRLPKAPRFLEGLLPYGGGLIPVVDLRKRVEVDAAVREETRIVVVESEQGKIGVVVDAVLEVLKVGAAAIIPPPPLVKGLAAAYISGVLSLGGRTIVILAASRLLSSRERLALDALTVEASRA
jgi:purine-binding chemotaxis protein CheW